MKDCSETKMKLNMENIAGNLDKLRKCNNVAKKACAIIGLKLIVPSCNQMDVCEKTTFKAMVKL